MNRTVVIVCAACALLLAPRTASSRVYYGFIVGVAKAPPPPAFRLAREPHAVLASDAMVYVVDDPGLRYDGDLFRYGQYWFAYSRGYWYRARSHRGPYAVIDVLKVPRAIIGVPRKLWKHPPLAPAAVGLERSRDLAQTRGVGRGKPATGAVAARAYGPPLAAAATARAALATPRSRRGASR